LESSWRLNVWETGMVGTQFRLVARLLPLLPFTRYVTSTVVQGVRWSAFSVGDDPTFGWQWVLGRPEPVRPFPFGENVLPD